MSTDPEYADRTNKQRRTYQRRYYKELYDSDPQHRAKMATHGKFHHMFRELVCMMREEERPLIGCTLVQLGQYLESQFLPGMTWKNYGTAWWIDHKIPIGEFDLTTPQGILDCWHFSNLQPMWKVDNIRKKNKILD